MVGVVLVMMAVSLGLALRLVIGLLSLLGLIKRKPVQKKRDTQPSPG
jgi:hypothetical protein